MMCWKYKDLNLLINKLRVNLYKPQVKYRSTKNEFCEEFINLYPVVKRDILDEDAKLSESLGHRIEEFLQYNIIKRNSYTLFPIYDVYQRLIGPEERKLEDTRLANILDWSLELILSGYLVVDDVIDQSNLRYGKTCWHLLEETALCDSKIMQMSAYKLLHKYFRNKPYYRKLLSVTSTTLYLCSLGQSSDAHIASDFKKRRDLNIFSNNNLKNLTLYKTTYFAGKLPTSIAMLLTNNTENEAHLNDIYQLVGQILQAQNDVWDCYADLKSYGKIGSDISEGKLTWLIVTAIKNANTSQLNILNDNYGHSEPKCYNSVMNVFQDLCILNKYLKFRDEVVQKILYKVFELTNDSVKEVFRDLVKHCIAQDEFLLKEIV